MESNVHEAEFAEYEALAVQLDWFNWVEATLGL